jgi:hypothetical protein
VRCLGVSSLDLVWFDVNDYADVEICLRCRCGEEFCYKCGNREHCSCFDTIIGGRLQGEVPGAGDAMGGDRS